jgi:arabinofuranosyltransferase
MPEPRSESTELRRRRAITPTLVGMIAVAAGLAVLAWHRRWISDDGLIVVRTVRELLAGNGPVYSAFERAEPNTSTLWTYVLALVGATGASLAHLAVGLGGLFAVGGVVLAMDGARRWHRARGATGLLAPAGALIVLGASPFWDFATSGLESGLAQLWLALAWWLLVSLRDDGARRQTITAVVLGLGPLVRPDFAIATIAFAAAAWWLVRPGARRAAKLAAVAAVLPVAYEIFRAGYYGALVPLPALAKSASAAEWGRGGAYLWNFLHPYALWLPFGVAAGVLGAALARRQLVGRDGAIAAAPIAAGLAMALYVVRLGGDFMHARMMLPAAFAVMLPAMLLPVGRRTAPALIVLVGWALFVGIRRDDRFSRLSASWLVDDRLGYRQRTHDRHPIDPALFIAADRPASQKVADAIHDGRRRLISEANDFDLAMNPALPGPVAYSVGRLGTGGAVVPLDGIVVDTLGLASPLGARITLTTPGMPGHEKRLPRAWVVAEFADASVAEMLPEAPAPLVTAARHALGCGELAELLASVRAPMTAARFWDNLTGSLRRTRLVIPADPIEAEARFCR